MFHDEKSCRKTTLICFIVLPARNSFPFCAESRPRLVQLPLSPLRGQAEPFLTVQGPAEPPPARTRMYIVQSDGKRGSGFRGLQNNLRISLAARSPLLFNLSSLNTKSLNQGAAVFSARPMYCRKSGRSAKQQGTGAHVAYRRCPVIALMILCLH